MDSTKNTNQLYLNLCIHLPWTDIWVVPILWGYYKHWCYKHSGHVSRCLCARVLQLLDLKHRDPFSPGGSQTTAPGSLGSGPEQTCHLIPVYHTNIIFCVGHRIKWLGSYVPVFILTSGIVTS